MAITQSQLDNWFQYHSPDAAQQESLAKIRAAAKAFAETIVECTVPCPDQTAAVRKIREATMTANAAVVLNGE